MKPIYEKINTLEDQSFYVEEVIKPYFPDPWHFHYEVEILYIREGFGTRFVGDSINSFSPSDIVIVGSNTPHVWLCDSSFAEPGNIKMSNAICIQFLEDFMGKSFWEIPELSRIRKFLNESKRGIQIVNRKRDKLIGYLERLSVLTGFKKVLELLTIIDIMSTDDDIIYLSSPNYKSSSLNSKDKDRMERIFQFIIQNQHKKLSLKDAASLVNLTPQSFCRYFKSRTNKAFSTFVNEVKIGKSCKMLIENEYTVSQICYATGFNYLSNFNKQFKKLKGMTPSEFRNIYNLSFLANKQL